MRKPRFTYIGAFHHVMNRALDGKPIFASPHEKEFFISLIYKYSKFYKINILAFVVMDNHYHLILQNTSGKLSNFMRQLNSSYALYWRKTHGGRGYVFQDRYKSTLINGEEYLLKAIQYALENPVRAGKVKDIYSYKWSSLSQTAFKYFSGFNGSGCSKLDNNKNKIEIKKTKIGEYLGEEREIEVIIKAHERRKEKREVSVRRREKEWEYKNPEEVIKEFEEQEKIKIEMADTRKKEIKQKRQKLLILLREVSGLTYSEINKIKIFQDIKLKSLSSLYWYAKTKFA